MARFVREPALAVAKVENFCSARSEPHWGQRGASRFLFRTSFFENVSTHRAGIFEDRHGLFGGFLGFNSATCLIVIPRRGRAAGRSREAGNPRNARQDEKPNNQESSVKQYNFHKMIIHPQTDYGPRLFNRQSAIGNRKSAIREASDHPIIGSPDQSDGQRDSQILNS